MILRKSTVAALSILVAVATAHPHSNNAEWNHTRYRWNDLFAARGQEVGARVRSQATVELSSCALVTETRNSKFYRVRVCPADPEDSPNRVCLGTRVTPCCPTNFQLGNLVSSTQVSVAGEDVTVGYYLTQDPTAGVCFRLDNAHLSSETCSQSRLEGVSCLPPCSTITTTCFNNTLNGDSSSCDGNVCQCKTGYLPPDCCQCDTTNFYLPDCRPFCRDNCRLFRLNNLGGCLTCRAGFTGAPECCQCEPGKTEINGVCKCDANLKPDGTCAEGALEPNCCECDTTGNETHAFYKTTSGECMSFCKSNCAVIGDKGCTTCNDGFGPEPDYCQCEEGLDEINRECKCIINTFSNGSCIIGAQAQNCCLCATAYQKNPDTGKCDLEKCDKNQTLYFYVDATRSNTFENFCPLIVVIQMLVAALNPSSTSGTKINALLFPDIPRSKDPSPVFDTNATCLEAIQGQNGSLHSLLSEFGVCLDNSTGRTAYNSMLFPSSCGEGTSAVKGLKKIYDVASSGNSSTESAVLMLTDGEINDDPKSLTKVLQNLNSVGISTRIAAGINDGTSMADRENLLKYTSNDNIVIEKDPITLGVEIVRKLKDRGIICKDHADNITASLNSARGDKITLPNGFKVSTLSLFCRCHRKEPNSNCARRTIKYPTCGGDLSIGVPLATTQEVELDLLILEEEILAAVESVLERFEG